MNWINDIIEWIKKVFSIDIPIITGLGKITVKGTKFKRSGKNFRIIGKAYDWAVQLTNYEYRKHVDEDAKLGINLYFAYAGPGLGKLLYTPNPGGSPYKNNTTLDRNENYWKEVDNRIKYANKKGISVVIANTFVDQGITHKYSTNLLKKDWKRTINRYKNYSVLWCPLSEYDEGGNSGITLGLALCNITPKVKCLHPVKSSGKHAAAQDFICEQGYSKNKMQADLSHGKPVICAEDQSVKRNAVKQIARFNEAENIGGIYIFTGWSRGWDNTMKNWLKSQR